MRAPLLIALLLSGCGSVWEYQDVDGDGYTPGQGDCWDSLDPVPGTTLTGDRIHPGAIETWYDGVDQDCASDDDFDADGDGWVVLPGHIGRTTFGVEGSGQGHKGSGDCWDAPEDADIPDDYAVVAEDVAGTAWAQPAAADVHPGADTDTWYDGVDQDCAGDDDFDADGDGWRAQAWPDQGGAYGDDCIDGADGDADNPSGADPAAVNPGASEVWYDGTDDDCDPVTTVDCDQDGDGYRTDPAHLGAPADSPCGFDEDEALDCIDTDASVYPDDSVDEVPYNGTDDNCDASDGDGDKDGDGHWAMDYAEVLANRGVTVDDTVTVPASLDDCWDDPDVAATEAGQDNGVELRVLSGFDALTAAAVHPGALDRPYDGADQDCADPDADSDGLADDFDWDGDGYAAEAWPQRSGATGGDCNDCPVACQDGSWAGTDAEAWCLDLCAVQDANPGGLDPSTVHPAATETWYDGTDQDCDDASDNDADGDGYDHESAGGDDCFEGTARDTDANPAGVAAASIHPDADETWYDGTDQDCDDASDNDADGDGDDHALAGGDDCLEGTALDTDANPAGLDPALVNVDATDTWYDGTDQDCSGTSDFDADRDGHDHENAGGTDCFEGTALDADPNPSGAHPAAIRPGAVEVWYDGTDDDCDDNDGDQDGDGHVVSTYAFTPLTGDPVDDCDDTDAATSPGAAERPGDGVDQDCDDTEICYVDADGDGARVDAATTVASDDLDCDDPGEAAASATPGDCDDRDATVLPGATELCDGLDNDCDGAVSADEADADGDDYVACTIDSGGWDAGSISGGDDCDDSDDTVVPGGTERCDGLDNDCDGSLPANESDADGDGYVECTVDAGGWDGVAISGGDDCDDTDGTVSPGEPEVVGDGIDQDCDGAEACFVDGDADGYHAGVTAASADNDCDDAGELGASASSGDCDDADATIHPGATEVVADGVDQDCDGGETCFVDADDDGYRPDATSTVASADADCTDAGEATLTDPQGDCDESDAGVNPGATEVCDAADVDEDCDGLSDADDPSLDATSAGTWYVDVDRDGYGDLNDSGTIACDDPSSSGSSYVADNTDCDDGNVAINPSATEVCDAADTDEDCDGLADDADTSTAAAGKSVWYVDADDDGYGTALVASTVACDDPSDSSSDYASSSTDCDDADAAVHPGATEVTGDGADQDCDGTEVCYVDADDDGYRPDSSATVASSDPDCSDSGEALGTDPVDDCDDTDGAVNPGATEVCDALDVDEDCSGAANDADPGLDASSATTWFIDADGDGYGDLSDSGTAACEDPSGATVYVADNTDCDDGASDVNPGATEVCDASNTDEDCDGAADDADLSVDASTQSDWYEDADEDGYGDATSTQLACDDPTDSATAWVADDTDCDDTDAAVNPGAAEVCDDGNTDEDCNLVADDADAGVDLSSATDWYPDTDEDGYGDDSASALRLCDDPSTTGSPYVDDDTDCDDTEPAVSPAALEVCDDGIDNDCDGDPGVCELEGDVALATGGDGRWLGERAGDFAGAVVVGLGDVTGDGLDDYAVGANGYDAGGGGSDHGRVYLLSGVVSGDVSLSTARATADGAASGDAAGGAVASGDVDGDGTPDLVLGVAAAGSSDDGELYVVYGPLSGSYDLSTDADVSLPGSLTGEEAGTSVAVTGDVDGDGTDDILVGAPFADLNGTDAGMAYLVLGAASASGSIGSSSAILAYGEDAGDEAGNVVAVVGDLDGDGGPEVLVSAWLEDAGGTDAGAMYLFTGPTSGIVSLGTADIKIVGAAADEGAGWAVHDAGDVNDDGYDDLLVGAPFADALAGAAYLVHGSPSLGSTVDLSTAAARLSGEAAGDLAGYSVAGNGDVNGDGSPDLLVGAPDAGGTGAAYLLWGPVTGTVSLGGADATFTGSGSYESAGVSLAIAGDVDGDGYDDILIGASDESTAAASAGATSLFLGGGL